MKSIKKNYVCGICGKEYEDLNDYLSCVAKCGETVKAEQKAKEEKERLEKLNAALNGVKQAKKYYEEQLAKFEAEYPEEYKLNFGGHTCKCAKSKDTKIKSSNLVGFGRAGDAEFTYEQRGNDKPKITAKVNGKDVNDENLAALFDDPDCRYIAKMLGII